MQGVNVSEKPADYLELGPNCPPHGRCLVCKEHHWCRYETASDDKTMWMVRSKQMFDDLVDCDVTGFKRMVKAVTLAQYLIHHRGYYRLADTLIYLADGVRERSKT